MLETKLRIFTLQPKQVGMREELDFNLFLSTTVLLYTLAF